jgi:hypothetical protein
MRLEKLIAILENKLMFLNGQLATCVQTGELQELGRIEQEIFETELTLQKLKRTVNDSEAAHLS